MRAVKRRIVVVIICQVVCRVHHAYVASTFMNKSPGVALITGAGRGRGRAAALALAMEGYKVSCAARYTRAIEHVARSITVAGGEVLAFICGVTRIDDAREGGDHEGASILSVPQERIEDPGDVAPLVVFLAKARERAGIVARPRVRRAYSADDSVPQASPASMSWMVRLRRVFAIDLSHCSQCGGELQMIGTMTESGVIARILQHLGMDGWAQPHVPAMP